MAHLFFNNSAYPLIFKGKSKYMISTISTKHQKYISFDSCTKLVMIPVIPAPIPNRLKGVLPKKERKAVLQPCFLQETMDAMANITNKAIPPMFIVYKAILFLRRLAIMQTAKAQNKERYLIIVQVAVFSLSE